MVDFQSKQRVHWFGYKATVFPEPSCSYREQYHVQDRKTFPAHINLAGINTIETDIHTNPLGINSTNTYT